MDMYDREGKPISMREWGRLHSNDEYRVVASETVGPYLISTVWLGLDHGFGRGSAPVIFETMVFCDPLDGEFNGHEFAVERYCTEEQARVGHDGVVTLVRATTSPVVAPDTPAALLGERRAED